MDWCSVSKPGMCLVNSIYNCYEVHSIAISEWMPSRIQDMLKRWNGIETNGWPETVYYGHSLIENFNFSMSSHEPNSIVSVFFPRFSFRFLFSQSILLLTTVVITVSSHCQWTNEHCSPWWVFEHATKIGI